MTTTDWYALLGVEPTASTDEVTAAVERRSRQAAAMATTSPERAQLLREQVRSIKKELLGGDAARAAYDARRAAEPAPTPVVPPPYPATAPPTAAPASTPVASPPPSPPPPPAPSGAPAPAVPADVARRWGKKFIQFMQTGWTCPACGESAMPGDEHCQYCGSTISGSAGTAGATSRVPSAQTCSRCGKTNSSGARFCSGCGSAISTQ